MIRERLKNATTAEEKEAALLAIRVLDPACGSGHFLLAAARRLALELARIRAGDDQPSEELRQQCMREVVAKCIYGVDRNTMAVELCKVALWMEAIEPGKPLGFLDAHIQCGDSLVGVFDPKVLDGGIPDGAYKPLTGDEKEVCTSLKKDNQAFAKRGQGDLFSGIQAVIVTPSQEGFEAIKEEDLAGARAKQLAYAEWLEEPAVQRQRLAANTYTAAFFLKKDGATRSLVPTSEHLDALVRGGAMQEAMEATVQKAAADFRFLHWYLVFPDAMAAGGFDCVLGNPPWEVLEEEEKKFFGARHPEIAAAPGAKRKRLILGLQTECPLLYEVWQDFSRERESFKEFHRMHPALRLSSYKKLNLYASFLEISSTLVRCTGRVGLVIQGGFLSDESRSKLASELISSKRIIEYLEFNNSVGLFVMFIANRVLRSLHFSAQMLETIPFSWLLAVNPLAI